MGNEIAIRPASALDDNMTWCKAMADSSMLPRQYQGKPANLLFALEYADALGISRIHALTSIHVVEGKPTASADLIASMIRRAGHKLRIVGDDTYAEATLIRADDPDFPFIVRWDEARARKAALWNKKGPWQNYPAAMLRSRAITEVARMGASDVLSGVIYTAEELDAVIDESGNPIAGPAAQPNYVTSSREEEPQQVRGGMAGARDRLAASASQPSQSPKVVDLDEVRSHYADITEEGALQAAYKSIVPGLSDEQRSQVIELTTERLRQLREATAAAVDAVEAAEAAQTADQGEPEQTVIDAEIEAMADAETGAA